MLSIYNCRPAPFASTATITATTNNNDVQQWDFASNNHVEEYSQDTVSPILSEYASTATITATTNNNDVQQWDFASNNHVEEYSQDTVSPIISEYGSRPANGNASAGYEYGFEPLPPSRKKHSVENMSSLKNARSWDRSNRSSDASTKPTWTDDLSAPKRAGTGDKRTTADQPLKHWDDENSKWIHRDKLAKIESRELQAAGIYLPRSRASSKVRKGRSEERHQGTKRTASAAAEDRDHSVPASRHRKNSSAAENSLSDNQAQTPSWDLRLPEEIEAEGDPYWTTPARLALRQGQANYHQATGRQRENRPG
ncbi:hypothetical protein HYQ46_000049 [Verticillium longisporum]|nr:hypothetical protein HYQ46_000049 [Verticillium longisporum]